MCYQHCQNYAATTDNSWRAICIGLPSFPNTNTSILSALSRKIVFHINFNQSVITKESFRSDWIEIKHISVKFLFD